MSLRSLLVAALGLLTVLVSGCSAVIGASCAPGRVLCAGHCVDLDLDPAHCGACERACGAGLACVGGVCGTRLDAGPLDGALDADAGPSPDAAPFDAPVPDDAGLDGAGLDGAGLDGAGLDGAGLDGAGLDATADALAGDAPTADVGPLCVAPDVACAGLCVDLETDPEHCGACGVVCPSGLCVARTCMGGPVGHVVVIGHDYETSRIAMRRIVGNAVFLARTSPVVVLAYDGDSSAASRSGTNTAIDATATALGRTWTRAVVTAAGLPAALPTGDVLLVYAQRGATDATLTSLGTTWASELQAFVDRGGIIVLLDTTSATNGGTHQLLEPAGLFTATGVTDISRTTVRVVAAGDAVGLGVPLVYRGETTTVRFMTSSAAVVDDGAGVPVVVHTTTAP